MDSQDNLKTLLSAVAQYVNSASTNKDREEYAESEKWVVLNPSDPPGVMNAVVYDSYKAATEARKKSNDNQQHTFGALTVILNMSDLRNWYGHPIGAIHATSKRTTLVGHRDNNAELWEYPSEEYTTFVIVVPNAASGKAADDVATKAKLKSKPKRSKRR